MSDDRDHSVWFEFVRKVLANREHPEDQLWEILTRADAPSYVLVSFCCRAATRALRRVEAAGFVVDPRSFAAIEARLSHLEGDGSCEDVEAALAEAVAAANEVPREPKGPKDAARSAATAEAPLAARSAARAMSLLRYETGNWEHVWREECAGLLDLLRKLVSSEALRADQRSNPPSVVSTAV